MFNPDLAPAGSVASDGTVLVDIPCRKCGYNLRALSATGLCPECGHAIDFSVQGDLLQFSPVDWLKTLSQGARLVVVGILLAIVGGIVASIIDSVASTGEWIQQAVGTIAFIVMTVGWWRLTEPDPSGLGEDRYGTARKLIRIGVMTGIVEHSLDIVIALADVQSRSTLLPLQLLSLALNLMSVIALFAQLVYLRKLMFRVPNLQLAKQAKTLIWAFAIGLPVSILLIFIAAAAGSALFFGLGFLAWLLVVVVMYILLISRCGREFERLASKSRWVGEDKTRQQEALDALESM